MQDLRYAIRVLSRTPGFTLIAVLTLALGIGANSAVFSVVNALLFKPLPVDQPNRLVWMYGTQPDASEQTVFSYPDYLDYRAQAGAFSDLFGFTEMPFRIFVDGRASIAWGAAATENFFTGIRLQAKAGRTFSAADGNDPGSVPLAVISDGLWRRQFGGDLSAIGKPVSLNGREFTIVGVLPAEFSGTRAFGFIPEVWIPLAMIEQVDASNAGVLKNRNAQLLFVMGRLRPGAGMPEATASLAAVDQRLNQQYRKPFAFLAPHLMTGARKISRYVERTGLIQFGSALTLIMVGLVLLIACANVANLMLTRLASRRREISVRLALGASWQRLVRQLLLESFLVSLAGGALGLLIGTWLKNVDAMKPHLDFEVVETAYTFGLDWRIVAFTTAVTFIAAIASGLMPALQSTRMNLTSGLRGVAAGKHGNRLRTTLMVGQVALCVVLMVCAGLAVRSALNAGDIDPGFATSNLLFMRVNLQLQDYDQARRKQFAKDLQQRLMTLPGVEQATLGFPLPLDAYDNSRTAAPEDFVPSPANDRGYDVGFSSVAPGYFGTMQTRLLSGREFDEFDTETTDRVVIVNRTLAQRFWPDQEPIGKRIRLGEGEISYATVVGVAHDGKYMTLGESPLPYMFFAALQSFPDQASIVVRTNGINGSPGGLAGPVREEIRRLDPSLAVLGVQTIDQFRDRFLSLPKTLAGLLMIFGSIALLLAGIGLYGVVSVSVGQRAKEIGIRMAIGAGRGAVVRMVMRQSSKALLLGCALGLFGALAFARVMRSILFSVNPADSLTLFTVVGLVLLVGAVAAYVPARRAAAADPLNSLRME